MEGKQRKRAELGIGKSRAAVQPQSKPQLTQSRKDGTTLHSCPKLEKGDKVHYRKSALSGRSLQLRSCTKKVDRRGLIE